MTKKLPSRVKKRPFSNPKGVALGKNKDKDKHLVFEQFQK